MKSCFFIGHRDASESIRTDLTQAITELIERQQVQEFIVAAMGDLIRLFRRFWQKLRNSIPELLLDCFYHTILH